MTGPARGPVPRRDRHRGRPRLLLALAGLLPLAAGLLVPWLRPGSGARCEEISVPAYFYPGAAWTRAIDSRPAPAIMILDITSSGAGSAPNQAYAAAAARARAAGIKILGYAATGYARRPVAAVEADVRHYRAWYHVSSIFLDEAATGTGELSYYQKLTGYIRHRDPGAVVMLNPGTYPSRRYMALGDVVLAYEGSYARYATLRVPAWVDHYPAAQFSHVVYATPRLAAGRGAPAGRAAARRLRLRDRPGRAEPLPFAAPLLGGRGRVRRGNVPGPAPRRGRWPGSCRTVTRFPEGQDGEPGHTLTGRGDAGRTGRR